jgi:hypothetical protein
VEDAPYNFGDLLATLTINIAGGTWAPKYQFWLHRHKEKPEDPLQVKLREKEEEIAALKSAIANLQQAEPGETAATAVAAPTTAISVVDDGTEKPREVAFFSLWYNGYVDEDGVVGWTADEEHEAFAVSEDGDLIAVQKAGVYLVNIRLVVGNDEEGGEVTLRVNEGDVASALCAVDADEPTAVQLTEVLKLQAGDQLTVLCSASDGVYDSELGNKLTMTSWC